MSNKVDDILNGKSTDDFNLDVLDGVDFEEAAARNDARIDEQDAEAAAIPVDNGCGAGGCII